MVIKEGRGIFATDMKKKVAIIGGGAAGFFCAANLGEMSEDVEITILEQGKEFLSKVRVSGGGRCNVTNVCDEPRELIKNYPRGGRELLGPFHKFATADTRWWFEARGVALKEEEDGRIFPVSDDSADIVNCLLKVAKSHGVRCLTHQKVTSLKPAGSGFKLQVSGEEVFFDFVVLTCGSSKYMNDMISDLGIDIVPPLPSLFTFNCKDRRLRDLAGISVPNVEVSIEGVTDDQSGPILITHQGFSGPAILKMSAFGARSLASSSYKFEVKIDWLPAWSGDQIISRLRAEGKRKVLGKYDFLPNRLWVQLLEPVITDPEMTNASLNKTQLESLVSALKNSSFSINGKATFKEEFVTAGGIDLREMDFRTFGLRKYPGLYAAGEILDIDGVTGGFNFQNAWTGAYLIAKDIAEKAVSN